MSDISKISDKAKSTMSALSSLWNKHKGAIKNVMNDVAADVESVKKSMKFKTKKSKKSTKKRSVKKSKKSTKKRSVKKSKKSTKKRSVKKSKKSSKKSH